MKSPPCVIFKEKNVQNWRADTRREKMGILNCAHYWNIKVQFTSATEFSAVFFFSCFCLLNWALKPVRFFQWKNLNSQPAGHSPIQILIYSIGLIIYISVFYRAQDSDRERKRFVPHIPYYFHHTLQTHASTAVFKYFFQLSVLLISKKPKSIPKQKSINMKLDKVHSFPWIG